MIGEKLLKFEAEQNEIEELNNVLTEKKLSKGQIEVAVKKIAIFLEENYLYIEIRNIIDFIKYLDWGDQVDNSDLTHWFTEVSSVLTIIKKGINDILKSDSKLDCDILTGEFIDITKQSFGIISPALIKAQIENLITEKLSRKNIKY